MSRTLTCMCMYIDNGEVRTTIEIPDSLRERLVAEAARRGEKGYSAVIERALRRYFGGPPETKREIVRKLKGCQRGETTAEAEHRRIDELRSGWRTGGRT